MRLKALQLTLFFASVVFLNTADAAITGWTEPVGSGADITATAATTIIESIANGASTLVTIQASGTTVTYAIQSQDTAGKLTIDSSSGLLTLAVGTFNYEANTTYGLVVVASDASDSTSGIATITLGITDDNDAPVFASAETGACVADGATAGTEVATMTATDEDGDTLTYSIEAGDSNSHFDITSEGVVKVNSGVTLDTSTTGVYGYSLTVTATDDGTGTLTDSYTLWIAVSGGGSAIAASILTMFALLIYWL